MQGNRTREKRDLRGRVAAAIRIARETKGWSQEELGRRLGVRQSTVAGWEGAGSFPGGETLQRIADETGMLLLAPAHPDVHWRRRRLIADMTAMAEAMGMEVGESPPSEDPPRPRAAFRPGRPDRALGDGTLPGNL